VRGAAGNGRSLYVADGLANRHILLSSEENGEPLYGGAQEKSWRARARMGIAYNARS
jgi:hypothetical protein